MAPRVALNRIPPCDLGGPGVGLVLHGLHACAHTHRCLCEHTETRGQPWVLSLRCGPLGSSLTSPEHRKHLDWVARKPGLGRSLSSQPCNCKCTTAPSFLMLGAKLGPYSYIANTSPLSHLPAPRMTVKMLMSQAKGNPHSHNANGTGQRNSP